MVNSTKRAKRKRLAQEAQRRETSRPAHQMDPADLSDPGTDREEEDDQEIKFTSRMQNAEEPLSSNVPPPLGGSKESVSGNTVLVASP